MTTGLPASLVNGVFWIPSVQNTATNMAAELEQKIVDNPGRKIIVIASEPFLLEGFGQQGILTNQNVNVDFGGCIVLYNSTSRSIDLDNTDQASAEVTVSSVADVLIHGDTESTAITIATTLNGEAHDWVALYSDDANPSKSGGRLGEIIQLIKDESGLMLNTAGKVCRTSDFGSNIKCRKLDASRRLRIHGGTWRANGDSDDSGITTREEAIRIIGFVDPKLESIEFEKPWAQCIWLQCTAGAIVNGYEVRDSLNMAGSNGYSYGVVLYGMNGNATVTNATVRNARHAAGTTDGNSGGTSTWYNKGYPTHYTFRNIQGYNSYGSIGDSHEEGFHGIWDGITVHSSATEEHQIFVGSAFQSRAARETIQNVIIKGGPRGIKFSAVDHGFEDDPVLMNVYIEDIHDTTSTARCIEFENNTNTNKRNYYLQNIKMDNVDTGLWVGKNNPLTFDGVNIAKAEEFGDIQAGAKVVGTNMVSDHRNTTAAGAATVFTCRSEAANGCEIRILDNPVVIKGSSSNLPTEFFTEADTTANKTVWHPGITEYNPDGVTSTLSKEAGSTTFVNATDVTTITL